MHTENSGSEAGLKEVVIHAGFHKTASSSIQHSLGQNRKLLAGHGYIYPDLMIDGARFYNQSVPLFGYYTSSPQDFRHYWYHNNIDHVRANSIIGEQLERELSGHNSLVFSDEFVSSLKENELVKLKEDFEARGLRLRIISFIREPYDLTVSLIQQSAKSSGIEQLLKGDRPAYEVRKIQKLLNVFGKQAEFYSFERACAHEGGPVGFFFNLLDTQLSPRKILRVNEGISHQAVRLASYINTVSPLFYSAQHISPIRKKFDLQPIFSIAGEKFLLSEKEASIIAPKAKAARKEIDRLLGQDFLPECRIRTATDDCRWNDDQLKQLFEIATDLDLHILLRVHDYFIDLQATTGKPFRDKIKPLDEIIRQRLDDEYTRQAADIQEGMGYLRRSRNRARSICYAVKSLLSR